MPALLFLLAVAALASAGGTAECELAPSGDGDSRTDVHGAAAGALRLGKLVSEGDIADIWRVIRHAETSRHQGQHRVDCACEPSDPLSAWPPSTLPLVPSVRNHAPRAGQHHTQLWRADGLCVSRAHRHLPTSRFQRG